MSGSYPPKHVKNGTRHSVGQGEWAPMPSDPWPGDTFTTGWGSTYRYQSDGSGWRIISQPQRKAA